jgi:hypothetical protein
VRQRIVRKSNIKIGLTEIQCEGVDRSNLAEDRVIPVINIYVA